MDSTWESRDLPVLETVVAIYDEGEIVIAPDDVAKRTGFDDETVQRALWALAHEEPPFFDIIDATAFGGRLNTSGVRKVTGHARRTVGAWPTAEGLTDRIIAALNEAAEQETEPEKKGRLKKAAEAVGGVGKDVIVRVLSEVVVRQVMRAKRKDPASVWRPGPRLR